MKQSDDLGFSLLEVMVSLAILAIALVVLTRTVTGDVRATQHSRMVTAATFLARTKISSLEQLMKDQVPAVNTKLTNNLKKFSKKSKDIAGLSAILAVIAQDAMLYVSDTKKPEEAKKWFDFSVQMRDAAAAVNAQTHANDEKAATAAGEKLNQSCHDCHAVFHEEKNEKTEK